VVPQIVTGIRGWLVTLWSIRTTELLLVLESCTYWVWWHWLDLLRAGLEGAITVKSRPVRTYSYLAVFATKDSSLNGARRVSSVVTVVTLVIGFHRPAVLGELSSLSVLPSYDGRLWQLFDHPFLHHRHDLCFWPVSVASFVSSCRIVSGISLYFLQLLRIQFLGV
jgi:hypothetical protein